MGDGFHLVRREGLGIGKCRGVRNTGVVRMSTLGAMLTGEVTLGRWLGAQTEKIDPLEQKGRCSLCRRVDGANLVWIR